MPRILIIEDDRAILNQYSFFLAKQGFDVLTADSAQSGLTILRRNQVDLIILDLLMPTVSGLDFLRSLKLNPQPKVIVLSNMESPKIRQEVLALGVSQYLLKVNYTPSHSNPKPDKPRTDRVTRNQC